MMPSSAVARPARRGTGGARPHPDAPPPRRVPDRKTAVVAVAVALVAIAVRLPGALDLPLWQDEVASARVLLEPDLAGVLDHVRRTESTPPAWYVIAWPAVRAGSAAEHLRLLSVALGGLLAALVVVAARRVLPLWAAALAGALTAVGWQAVAHGRELRAYALLMVLAVAFGLALERAGPRPTVGRLAVVAALGALGLLTHYFFAFTLAAAALWVALRRTAPVRLAGALGVAAVPSLVWLPSFLEQAGDKRYGWIDAADPLKVAFLPSTLWDPAGALYAAGIDARVNAHGLLRLAVLAVVLAGAWLLARRSPAGLLWALLAVVPVALAGLAWVATDVFNTRNLLATAPFAAVAVAAAVAAAPRLLRAPAAGLVVALALAGLAAGEPFGPPVDRVADALVAQGWREGDAVLLFGGYHDYRSPLGWYLPGRPTLRALAPPPRCARLHVVAADDVGRAFVARRRVATKPVSYIRIGTASWTGDLGTAALTEGAYLLGVPDGRPCSRASTASVSRAVS